MENNNLIIEINNLCKSYRSFKLNDISFSLSRGEVVGLIGPNGAGKSTLIKLILNIVESDSGEVIFLGEDISNSRNPLYKEKIGYVGEYIDYFPNQKIKNIKRFYQMYFQDWDEQIYQYLFNDVFELSGDIKIKELSKGMRVKFSLALALSHNPKLLIMDEPTSGLDPIVRSKILKILRAYSKENGTAILFSSHITEDMNKIADKLIFLNHGKILGKCQMDEMKKKKCKIDEYLERLIGNEESKYEKNLF